MGVTIGIVVVVGGDVVDVGVVVVVDVVDVVLLLYRLSVSLLVALSAVLLEAQLATVMAAHQVMRLAALVTPPSHVVVPPCEHNTNENPIMGSRCGG